MSLGMSAPTPERRSMLRQALLASAGLCVLPGWAHAGAPAGQAPRQTKRAPAIPPVPEGYRLVARRVGIPAGVMFAVALQESKMRFGAHSLPFPWTLCVAGEGRRFKSYDEALADLTNTVKTVTRNVDCGAMQVNWRWHRDKLGTFEQALDPYSNLTVGAFILREQFAASGHWFRAVGRYHNQVDKARATRYASSVLALLRRVPGESGSVSLMSHGIT